MLRVYMLCRKWTDYRRDRINCEGSFIEDRGCTFYDLDLLRSENFSFFMTILMS